MISEQLIQHIHTIRKRFESPVEVCRGVRYDMRKIVERSRRYYYGQFEQPEPSKRFINLTKILTDAVIKSIDLDTKDITVFAREPGKEFKAEIMRRLLRHWLTSNNFGIILNDLLASLVRDGSAVLKKVGDKIYRPNLLNIWVDPGADNFQKTAIIEKHTYTPEELREVGKDWDNVNNIEFKTDKGAPYVDIYEMWGWFSKELIGGSEPFSYGVLIASDQGVHFFEKADPEDNPFYFFVYEKVEGRLYGMGVPETTFDLQVMLNEVINLRLRNFYQVHSGIWEVTPDAGIRRENLENLEFGGILFVNRPGALRKLDTGDIKPSSYKEEENVIAWGQRLTEAYELVRGENLPASTPATTALILSQRAQTKFDLILENIGLQLTEFLRNKIIPDFKKQLSQEKIIRISGDMEFIKKLDEKLIEHYLTTRKIEFIKRMGRWPSDLEVQILKEDIQKSLKGKSRYFVDLPKDFFNMDIDVEFNITNENFNKAVVSTDLRMLLAELSRIPDLNLDLTKVAKKIIDLMGFAPEMFEKDVEEAMPQMQGGIPGMVPPEGSLSNLIPPAGPGMTPTPSASPMPMGTPEEGPGTPLPPQEIATRRTLQELRKKIEMGEF